MKKSCKQYTTSDINRFKPLFKDLCVFGALAGIVDSCYFFIVHHPQAWEKTPDGFAGRWEIPIFSNYIPQQLVNLQFVVNTKNQSLPLSIDNSEVSKNAITISLTGSKEPLFGVSRYFFSVILFQVIYRAWVSSQNFSIIEDKNPAPLDFHGSNGDDFEFHQFFHWWKYCLCDNVQVPVLCLLSKKRQSRFHALTNDTQENDNYTTNIL